MKECSLQFTQTHNNVTKPLARTHQPVGYLYIHLSLAFCFILHRFVTVLVEWSTKSEGAYCQEDQHFQYMSPFVSVFGVLFDGAVSWWSHPSWFLQKSSDKVVRHACQSNRLYRNVSIVIVTVMNLSFIGYSCWLYISYSVYPSFASSIIQFQPNGYIFFISSLFLFFSFMIKKRISVLNKVRFFLNWFISDYCLLVFFIARSKVSFDNCTPRDHKSSEPHTQEFEKYFIFKTYIRNKTSILIFCCSTSSDSNNW